jgi:hypothetical protein
MFTFILTVLLITLLVLTVVIFLADILATLTTYSRQLLPKEVFDEISTQMNALPHNTEAKLIFLYEDCKYLAIGYIDKIRSYIFPYCITVRDISYLVYRYSDEFEFFETLRAGYGSYTDEQLKHAEWKLFVKNSVGQNVKDGTYGESEAVELRNYLLKFENSDEFQARLQSLEGETTVSTK